METRKRRSKPSPGRRNAYRARIRRVSCRVGRESERQPRLAAGESNCAARPDGSGDLTGTPVEGAAVEFGRGVEEMNAHQRRVAKRAKAGKKQQWLKKKTGLLAKIKKVFGQ